MPPDSQLRRVVRALQVVLPFRVGLNVAMDDVHLEVEMYALDRDFHLRVGEPAGPRDRPHIRQVFSYDMSDEALAARQMHVEKARERNPRATAADLDRLYWVDLTDEEVARLVLACVEAAVVHEVREGFYHRGARIADPHRTDGSIRR